MICSHCLRDIVPLDNTNVKVDDVVRVTFGEGTGKRAKVLETHLSPCHDLGTPMRYWHTLVLHARLIDDWGDRTLYFDWYEVLP